MKNLFQSARLKLTIWYAVILLTVSGFLSFLIYQGIVTVLGREYYRIEQRIEAQDQQLELNGRPLPKRAVPKLLLADFKQAKNQIALRIIWVNGVIFLLGAGASYFLAGRTLEPIEQAMDNQRRFVTDASHELRTPLAALKAQIEVALRDKKLKAKEAREVLVSNLEEVDSLQKLTDRLLNIAKFQQDGKQFRLVMISADKAIKKMVKKVSPLAKKKKIKLTAEVSNQKITADKSSFAELVLILLDNAIKYTPTGGQVNLSTRTDKKHFYLIVSDTGTGIPAKDLPHIFNRFYRVSQARSRQKTRGFGLGLALAKQIVDSHHGTIQVSSSTDQGTAFRVKIPVL